VGTYTYNGNTQEAPTDQPTNTRAHGDGRDSLSVIAAGRPSADGVEVGDFLFGDDIVVVGPRVQKLALFIETLFAAAKERAVFGAPEVGFEARAVGEAVQIHRANRLQRVALLGEGDKGGNAVGFDALWRSVETDARDRAKLAKPLIALQQLGIAQRDGQPNDVHDVLLAHAQLLEL